MHVVQGEVLLAGLVREGATLGSAFLEAKRQMAGKTVMLQSYNLLGDPALELARPVEGSDDPPPRPDP